MKIDMKRRGVGKFFCDDLEMKEENVEEQQQERVSDREQFEYVFYYGSPQTLASSMRGQGLYADKTYRDSEISCE